MDGLERILIFILVFAVAGSIHEFAHAASAYALGDPTAKNEGRMTLNPIAHVDIVGTLIFPIFIGIGWMKPVPVFLGNLKHPMRDDAIISFAGPFSNFIQASFALLIYHLFFSGLPFSNLGVQILIHYAKINILLMGFNLLPFPPLDGGAILRYFIPRSKLHIFDMFARYSFIILIVFFLTGMLHYFLIPFSLLFSWIASFSITGLIFLNLINIGVVLYFYREELGLLKSKIEKGKFKVVKPEAHSELGGNKGTIYLAETVLEKIDLDEPLSEKEKLDIYNLKQSLDKKANICPPSDYDVGDNTCQNCDWFKNCLVRKVESSTDDLL